MILNGLRPRRVAVFSGNGAAYGLQLPILKAIAADPRLEYYLLISGANVLDDSGRTLTEIEIDGFEIHERINIDFPEDGCGATATAIGSLVGGLSAALAELKPDFLVVYAGRFESFAAVIAGTQMGIPTAHVEGGDDTEGGALGDSVRHAMTKLAHLHFTTNEQAAERVRRLGEEPWRVFNVGYAALDLVSAGLYARPEEVYRRFRLDPTKPIVVFTQHAVAAEFDQAADQVRPALEALDEAGDEWGVQSIITHPNDDAGGRRIVHELRQLEARQRPWLQVHRRLGRSYYHGALNVAAACAGNSSSGIKETPAFHCACIDIGSRQRRRPRSTNVLSVDYNRQAIKQAIWQAAFDEDFRRQAKTCVNPYGVGNAGPRIADVLATVDITPALTQKQMTY